jgi:hypothetical protein
MPNRRKPYASLFCVSVSTWVRASGSSIGPECAVVGTLWSAVASTESLRQGRRPASRRPSNACGEVTSCTMWRSMYNSEAPSPCSRTTC